MSDPKSGLPYDPRMTIAGIFVFLLPLAIAWCFLTAIYNSWLSATPERDLRPYHVYANIWLIASLALLIIEIALIIFLVRASARRRAERDTNALPGLPLPSPSDGNGVTPKA